MPLFASLSTIYWIPILCFVVGFILVVVEMFHPGFGAPGITGGILLVLGVILSATSFLEAFIMIIIILAILGVALTIVLQSVVKGRLPKNLILQNTQKKEEGYTGTEDLKYFLEKEGTTLTVLRPSGLADFQGVKLDVVSEGDFISKDVKVKIVKVEGRRIVVKAI